EAGGPLPRRRGAAIGRGAPALLLDAGAPGKGRGGFHTFLHGIDDDASAVTLLLPPPGRAGNGDFLLANAKKSPNVDDSSRSLAVRSDQQVPDGSEIFAGGVVDVLIGVLVGRGADRGPVIAGVGEIGNLGWGLAAGPRRQVGRLRAWNSLDRALLPGD